MPRAPPNGPLTSAFGCAASIPRVLYSQHDDGGTASRGRGLGVPGSGSGWVYFALVASLLVLPGADWTTRGLTAAVVGLWRMARGRSGRHVSRGHRLVFFSPAAVLLVVAFVVLASGRSLS